MDKPSSEQPWLAGLFAAVAERARVLGYQVEHVYADFKNPRMLPGLMRTCRARGIRGFLVGPFDHPVSDPALPWDEFSWVTIGQSLVSPAVDRVGRDYDKDISYALSRLEKQGSRRPGFVEPASDNWPLLYASPIGGRKKGVPE